MNDHGKSDSRVVPAKLANKTGQPVAEWWRKGGWPRGTRPAKRARTQGRDDGASSALKRVRRVARKDKEARFTALLHHVDLARLWAAYAAISPKAAPGVDQVTWDAYGGISGRTSKTCSGGGTAVLTGRVPRAGFTYRSRTGGCGRSA